MSLERQLLGEDRLLLIDVHVRLGVQIALQPLHVYSGVEEFLVKRTPLISDPIKLLNDQVKSPLRLVLISLQEHGSLLKPHVARRKDFVW